METDGGEVRNELKTDQFWGFKAEILQILPQKSTDFTVYNGKST